MKNIFFLLLLLTPLTGFTQTTYLTNSDYFVVREKHQIHTRNYLVSYDSEMNRLGYMEWNFVDLSYKCQRDYILVFRQRSNVSNGIMSTYNKDFTLINQYRVSGGELRDIIPTDNYILTLENKGIFTPFYFVTYDKEFNKLGELRKRDRDIQYYLQNDRIIVVEGRKGNRVVTAKIKVYDKYFNLIEEKELQEPE